MKNFRLIVAICAALMIAAPAMALEVEVSGHYFVESFNNSNEKLSKFYDDVNGDTKQTGSNDYGAMELMVKPVFKVNDNISITTQFTALQEHVWGDDANAKLSTFPFPITGANPKDISGTRPNTFADNSNEKVIDGSNNIDWKAAYMTLKTPIGGFIVGRYIDTPWGLGLGDTTASHGSNDFHKDRIMWVVPVGDFISGAVYQRNEENDKGLDVTDQDFTKAYVFSAYKQENWSAGLLFANYQHKNYLSSKNLAYASTSAGYAIESAALLGGTPFGPPNPLLGPTGDGTQANYAELSDYYYNTRGEMTLWVLDPYFKGQFGPVGIEAELLYGWGDVDQNGQGTEDLDAEGLGYMFDLSYQLGPVKLWGGTTYVQGDTDYTDGTTSPMGYFERSIDHERGFLLTSDTSDLERSLGGSVTTSPWSALGQRMGNSSGGPGTASALAGYQSFYFGLDWQVLENLKLSGLYVDMTADDAPYTNPGGYVDPLLFLGSGGVIQQVIPNVQWDDEIGQEIDITLTWDIMPNLTLKGLFAYLEAGDFWKQGDPTKEVENNTTIYTRLIVNF